MSRNRPEPKPMKHRRLAMLAAGIAICCVGALVIQYQNRNQAQPIDAATPIASSSPTQETNPAPEASSTAENQYAGLDHAGIPHPGEWSGQQAMVAIVQDDNTVEFTDETITITGAGGPIEVALEYVNNILDPTTDDDTWARLMAETLVPDEAGFEHPTSSAPRYWWNERQFYPRSACKSSQNYTAQGFACSTMSTRQLEQVDFSDGTKYIHDQGGYYASETNFPIPQDAKISSLVNPQTVVSQNYNTVFLPMDDGNWHITVLCSFNGLANKYLDEQGNSVSTSDYKPGDTIYVSLGGAGYGMKNAPCQVVELTVGQQKPFWYIGD